MFLIALLGKLCHLPVKIPEGIVHIPLITCHWRRSSTSCTFVGRPALYQPARSRIYFLQRLPAIGRQALLQCFPDKTGNITGCLLRHIEMSPARITKERDTALRIHHPKSQCRIYPGFPPFILAFNHQAGNAVNVPCPSPLQVFTPVTAQVGARRIPMERHHRQCTFRIPGRKVPRESGHGRMSERNERHLTQFRVSTHFRQIVHHLVKHLLRTFAHIPLLVYSGSNPNQPHSHLGQRVTERRHIKQHLFRHVLLAPHHGRQALAMCRNPQEGFRFLFRFVRYKTFQCDRPLPLSGTNRLKPGHYHT